VLISKEGEYMNTLVMGTTNQAKINQIRGCLLPIGIDVIGVADKNLLPKVEEDGKTVKENARIKAVAYSKALGHRVLSMDNALFLNGLPEAEQPGVHVRRINGIDASSDDVLLEHYQKVVRSLGNRVDGYWEFGICVADPDGQTWETVIRSPRIFTSTKSSKVVPGYPLESIQIDPKNDQYISEMSEAEQTKFWQKAIGEELQNFMRQI
jgi:XTP/dITP diphosphohydrolase